MPRLLPLLSLIVIVTTGLAIPLHAADGDGKGPAYTEPPKEDPNYPLMGEFVGEIAAGEGLDQGR